VEIALWVGAAAPSMDGLIEGLAGGSFATAVTTRCGSGRERGGAGAFDAGPPGDNASDSQLAPHSYYGLENPVNRLRENFAVVCWRCETDHCAGRLPDSKFVAAQWKGKPDERQDHHNRGSG
jgi:hypothetical protein